jgi:HAD superfamily hydrolase (TIGR01509 family)
MRYPVVIFDVDGTLVDSNDAHAAAWVDTFKAFGRPVPFDAIRSRIGMGGDKLLDELAGIDIDSAQGQAMSTHRRKLFERDYLPTIQPTRGARELIARLHAAGHMLVVASSAQGDELDALLRIVDEAAVFAHTTSSDDAERSKPDPDIVQAAIARTGRPSSDAIMIGDTPYDVAAAKRCGIPAIALLSGGWTPEPLADAVAIFDDPADLLARYELSPLT